MIKYIIYLFAVYNSSSITTVYVVTFTFSLTRALTTGPRSESKHCYKYGFAGTQKIATDYKTGIPAVTLPTKIFTKSLSLKNILNKCIKSFEIKSLTVRIIHKNHSPYAKNQFTNNTTLTWFP